MGIMEDVKRVLNSYDIHVTSLEANISYATMSYAEAVEYSINIPSTNPYPFPERIARLDEPQFSTVVIEPPKEPPKDCWEFCKKCKNHMQVSDYLFCNYWHNFTEAKGYCHKFEAEKPVDNSA